MLSRIVTWAEEGLAYESAQRHSENIIEDLGLKGGKAVSTPIVRGKAQGETEEEEELDAAGAKSFRGIAASINHLALDRADLQYAQKRFAGGLRSPEENIGNS